MANHKEMSVPVMNGNGAVSDDDSSDEEFRQAPPVPAGPSLPAYDPNAVATLQAMHHWLEAMYSKLEAVECQFDELAEMVRAIYNWHVSQGHITPPP